MHDALVQIGSSILRISLRNRYRFCGFLFIVGFVLAVKACGCRIKVHKPKRKARLFDSKTGYLLEQLGHTVVVQCIKGGSQVIVVEVLRFDFGVE